MTKKFISISILIHILLITSFININYDFKKKDEINDNINKSLNVSLYEVKKYDDILYVEKNEEDQIFKNINIKNNHIHKEKKYFKNNDFINKINNDFYKIKKDLKNIEENIIENNLKNNLIEIKKEENEKKEQIEQIEPIVKNTEKIKKNNNIPIEKKLIVDNKLINEEDKKKYIYKLKKIIYKNWDQSKGKNGWDCRVEVIQNYYGSIIRINYLKCYDNEEFRNSIKKALYTSSPFPLPEKDGIFHNVLDFTFMVE